MVPAHAVTLAEDVYLALSGSPVHGKCGLEVQRKPPHAAFDDARAARLVADSSDLKRLATLLLKAAIGSRVASPAVAAYVG